MAQNVIVTKDERKYKTLVTDKGEAKIAEAVLNDQKVNITTAVVTDGGGQPFTPTSDMTEIPNEVWRGSIANTSINPASKNMIDVRIFLDGTVGGFTARGIGLLDDAGDLIAVCNIPDTTKAVIVDGIAATLTLVMHIVFTNVDVLEFKIDPSVDVVSPAEMDEAINTHNTNESAHPDMRRTLQTIQGTMANVGTLLSGKADPTEETVGKVGQHYLNTTTKKEFVCVAVTEGKYEWQSSGASSAADLTYGDKKLSEALDEITEDVAEAKPLTGGIPPTTETKGIVGQKYTDLTNGNTYVCIKADAETYTWKLQNSEAFEGKVKATGMLKGGKSGGVESATAGTDYQAPTKDLTPTESLLREDVIPVYSESAGDRSISIAALKDALGVQSPTIVVTTCEGATVTCKERDGEDEQTASGSCKFSLSKPGTYTVKAELSGTSAQTEVEVTGALQYTVDLMLLTGIAASGELSKSTFHARESFDPKGLTINATYADQTTEDVTSQCKFSPDPLTFGTSEVEISYTRAGITKTCTQEITVEKNSVTIPTQNGSVVYNGSSRTPAWNDYNSNIMDISGETSAVEAGQHNVQFTLKDTQSDQWNGGSTEPQQVSWKIDKAAGSLSVTPKSLSLTQSNKTGQVAVNRAGDGTITAQSSADGVASVQVQGNNIIVTGKSTGHADITVKVADGTNYTAPNDTTFSVDVDFSAIFGVCWNKTSSTALTRLNNSNDPNNLVTVNISTEPVPAVGNGNGSSPFDEHLPWSGMEEYNVSGSGELTKKGAGGFSRTTNDTVVYIPEFWYKITESDGKRYFYIANAQKAGFTKHPGSGCYVGKYNTGSGNVTKSGVAPLASQTRKQFRDGAKGKGTGWQLHDFAAWCAVQLLFLVEFADWDSQSVLGRGYVDGNSSPIKTGGTDSMTYHTGRAAGTDGKTQIQYRNIEDPWGNIWEWIDGINFNDRATYICTDPANYADDTSSNYTAADVTLTTDGWTKDLGMSTVFPWAYIPTAVGGSETTYIPDYAYSGTGWRVLMVGGIYSYGSHAGLWCFYGNSTSSSSYSSVGGRLLYKKP